MEALGGNAAGFGFSAKPQVVHGQGPYRDPYREYVYFNSYPLIVIVQEDCTVEYHV